MERWDLIHTGARVSSLKGAAATQLPPIAILGEY